MTPHFSRVCVLVVLLPLEVFAVQHESITNLHTKVRGSGVVADPIFSNKMRKSSSSSSPYALERRLSVNKEGFVYLIEAVGAKCVKVGRSICPWDRVKELQTGSCHELRLVAIVWCEDASRVESSLHETLKHNGRWLRNEWFSWEGVDAYALIKFALDSTMINIGHDDDDDEIEEEEDETSETKEISLLDYAPTVLRKRKIDDFLEPKQNKKIKLSESATAAASVADETAKDATDQCFVNGVRFPPEMAEKMHAWRENFARKRCKKGEIKEWAARRLQGFREIYDKYPYVRKQTLMDALEYSERTLGRDIRKCHS